MVNKLIKKIDNLINQITITFFVMFLIFGAYALFDAYTVKNTAKLSSQVLMLKPDENSEEQFSLKPLQEINPDICAWIKIEGTSIDYPIVIGKDNTEYLNRDYKKEYATAGSIFLDYRNERNFVDDYSIMYGHNMKKDLMFSDIKKFENAEFFENHKYGILYTELETYKVEIFAVAKVNAFSNDVYNLVVNKNGRNKDLISTYNASASFKRQLEFTDNDKLIVLSTCSTGGSNDRLVLVARIVKFNGDEDRLLINKSAEKSLEDLENKNNEKQEPTSKPYENKDANKTKKRFRLNVSTRTLTIWILQIVVVIIFAILIIKVTIQKIKKLKNRKNNNKKEEHGRIEFRFERISNKEEKTKKANIFAGLKTKILAKARKDSKNSKKEDKPDKKVAEKKIAKKKVDKNNNKKKVAKKGKVNIFDSLKTKVLALKDKIKAKVKAKKDNKPKKKVAEKKTTKKGEKKKEPKKENANVFEGIKVKLMGVAAKVKEKALDLKGKFKKETPKKSVKGKANKGIKTESKKNAKVATKSTTKNSKATSTKTASSKTTKTEAKKPTQKKTTNSNSTNTKAKTQGSKKKTSSNKK